VESSGIPVDSGGIANVFQKVWRNPPEFRSQPGISLKNLEILEILVMSSIQKNCFKFIFSQFFISIVIAFYLFIYIFISIFWSNVLIEYTYMCILYMFYITKKNIRNACMSNHTCISKAKNRQKNKRNVCMSNCTHVSGPGEFSEAK
jgi:hypothetical protein